MGKDIKVLGMKELRSLKKWKDALKKEFDEIDEANKDAEEAVPAVHVKTKEEIEDEELAEVDKQIDELKDEERRAARRKKKKELKEDQIRPKHEKYDKEKGTLDSNGLWYNEQIEEGKDCDDESDESDNGEELGLEWEENESDEDGDEYIEKQDEESSNPLITSLNDDDIGDRKARK